MVIMIEENKKSYEQAYDELLQRKAYKQTIQRKLEGSEQVLKSKKGELDSLSSKMYKEKQEVEQLENLSFSKVLAKIAGNYEEKYEKEYQEYISAKLKYDELAEYIKQLQEEIQKYRNEIRIGTAEIRKMEQALIDNYAEAKERANHLEEEKEKCYRKQVEVKEAISAAMKVYDLTEVALDAYGSAKGWSTYDTFFNGGLIADIAKYSKLDDAQEITNKIRAASSSMKKELKDVQMEFKDDIDAIDGSVRGFDMFFDNIFTDWNVRNRITDNIETLENYRAKVSNILSVLRRAEKQIKQELDSLQF